MNQEEQTVKTQNQKMGQKGAAAAEFAIVLPLLIILVFGIIDVGLALYNKQVITNASREGARAGIVAGTTVPQITAVVQNYCASRLKPGNGTSPTVSVTGGGSFQNDLTVTVSYVHNFMFAGIIGFGPTLTMTGQTVMKMQPVPPPSS
jgi:Flp pilus assembly protein TadG